MTEPLHAPRDGLPPNVWSRVREHMYLTGECDPADMEQMNGEQRYFVNQLKLIQRKLNSNYHE